MLAAVLLALTAKPTEYLCVDGLLVATFQSSAWHKVDGLQNRKVNLRFTKFGLGMANGTWSCGGIKKQEPNDELYADSAGDAPRGAMFTGPVSFPRVVKTLSNSNPSYVSALGGFLRSNGIATAPRLTRVISTDLDGDGTQEVILEGRSRDDLLDNGMNGHQRGDYSVVLLRSIRNGKVSTTPLLFDRPHSGDQLNYMDKIVAIADLDRDGTMEVITSSSYYEGGAYEMFKVRRGKVTKLAEHGDGV